MLKSRKFLWLRWLIITLVGSTIGCAFGQRIGVYVFPGYSYDTFYLLLVYLVMITFGGLFASFGQWSIFHSRLNSTWLWIPATTLGLPLGFVIGFFVNDRLLGYFPDSLLPFIMPSMAGMIAGILQCLALRRKWKDAVIWVLVSVFSWGIGFYAGTGKIVMNFIYSFDLDFYLYLPVFGLLIGTITGAISGPFVDSMLLNLKSESNYRYHMKLANKA